MAGHRDATGVEVRLSGQLKDLLKLLERQGWRVGRPRCLSVGGAADDQATVAEMVCGSCGNPTMRYTPLKHADRPDEYRAVAWCELCNFSEEW